MKRFFLLNVLVFFALFASSQCQVPITGQVNNPCFGDSKGTATANGTSGTSPYTYSWNNGQTNATATGLSAGTYTVTLTDAVACTNTNTVTITQKSAIVIQIQQTNPSCFGLCDGTATAIVTGGTSPYQYYWVPTNDTGATIINLCDVSKQGPYILNLADANGCTPPSLPVIINQPPGLAASVVSKNVCQGQANGNAYVNVTGGTGLYTYSWNPSGQTSNNATNLTVGTYTVTVTDAKGCSIQRVATITQPPTLNASTSQVNNTCNGGITGSGTVNVTGGTPNYQYLWSSNPAQFTSTATALGAGSYTVTVTDDNGCTLTRTFNITEPAPMAHNANITTATCLACDGKVTVSATGGASPYTYSWSGGQTTTGISALCAGLYSLTITDNGGCSKSFAIAVNNNGGSTTANTSQTNIQCGGNCTGTASITPTGGTTPYTYSWSSAGQTTAAVSGICAGAQTIKVTDAAGCVNFYTVTITEPPAISPTVTKNDITCNNMNNGSVSVATSGGIGAYTYSWNPGGATTANINGLSGGNYTLTITDGTGCTVTRTVGIINPAQLICSTTPTNPTCNGANNGSASSLVTGGTQPYTYFWSPNGGTGSTGTGLSAGNYTVTITDKNGCTVTKLTTINQPAAITASFNTTHIPCFGGTTGSTTASAASGVGAYTYSWIPGGQTGTSRAGLSAGTYSLSITDGNGCSTTVSVTINAPAKLAIAFNKTDAGCGTCTNGSADANVSGGVNPYTYSWSNGQTTFSATGLSVGLYTVCITDANNCQFCDTIRIKNVLDAIADYNASDIVKIHPNPAKDHFVLDMEFPGPAGNVTMSLLNILGERLWTSEEHFGRTLHKKIDTSPWPPGTYFVEIQANNQLYRKKLVKQ